MLRRVSQLMFLIAILCLPAAWPDDYCLQQCIQEGDSYCTDGTLEEQQACKAQVGADCRCVCYPRSIYYCQ